MVVYFSGTGNSKYCAEKIAAITDDGIINSAEYIKNGIAVDIISEKPWVFVCPIYAWQMPAPFAEFIAAGDFKGSKKVYFVMTCGGDIGAAQIKAKELCDGAGLEYCGTQGVVMPDNYIVMFKAPTAEQCGKIIAKADSVIEKAAMSIKKGEKLTDKKVGFFDKIKSGAVNKGFSQMYIKSDKFFVSDKCISCGKCVDLCPLGNISMVENKPSWDNKCTQCMACISYCPTEAIEYGKGTVGKRRYRFPM